MTDARNGRKVSLLLAALIASVAPLARAAEPLGSLFFTPQERAELEARRRQSAAARVGDQTRAPSDSAAAALPQRAAQPKTPPRVEKLTGYVLRSSGNNTMWLDFEPRYRAPTPPSLARPREKTAEE